MYACMPQNKSKAARSRGMYVAAVVKEPQPFKKALNIARDAKCSNPKATSLRSEHWPGACGGATWNSISLTCIWVALSSWYVAVKRSSSSSVRRRARADSQSAGPMTCAGVSVRSGCHCMGTHPERACKELEGHVPELERDPVPDLLRVLGERHRAVILPCRPGCGSGSSRRRTRGGRSRAAP